MPQYNTSDFYPRTGAEIDSSGNVKNDADGINSDGSHNVKVIAHQAYTIQTHGNGNNGVSIGASSYNNSSWIDLSQYGSPTQLALTLLNDSGTANNYSVIFWSNDGTNIHGQDSIIPAGTGQYRAGSVSVKARYVKIQLGNNDSTNPHTMSAWTYLAN